MCVLNFIFFHTIDDSGSFSDALPRRLLRCLVPGYGFRLLLPCNAISGRKHKNNVKTCHSVIFTALAPEQMVQQH